MILDSEAHHQEIEVHTQIVKRKLNAYVYTTIL